MPNLNLKKSLLKTASVLAITLFAFPVLAQGYSSASIDPYGYGNVPLPPPQPQYQQMVMPSYQAQQAAGSFLPLNRYAPQYSTPSQAALYAGQSSPHVVTTAQYGVVPDYLPENRLSNMAQSNVQPSTTAQASSVGYVVQPQAGGIQQPAPQGAQYAPQGAAPAQYGAQVGAQAAQATAPYAGQAYGAVQQAPAAYGAVQNVAQNAAQGAAQGAANPYATNTVNTYAAPQASAPTPTYSGQAPSSYSPANAAVQNSITTANVDGSPNTTYQPLSSYQNASSQQANTQQAYAPQAMQQPAPQAYASQQVQQPYIGQTYQAPAQAYDTPQPQAYTYGNQPQTYTTTQIYTPSPALTVQQTADTNSQAYAPQAAAPVVENSNVSLATDPSVGPWYFSLRSGLTLAQDTAYRSKGSDVANEYQTGWEMGTGVGYEFKGFNSWLAPRAELELTYDQQLVDTSTTKGVKSTDPNAYGFQRNLDLMANGFLDFRLNRYLAPYVGGGVGVGYADFDRYGTSAGGVTMDDNDVGFVWQAMGGLGINISNSAMVDFGYRYQQNTGVTLKAEDGTTSTTDEGKHVIMIGFRNNF